MSSAVIVVRSHFTKKAWFSVVPIKAPLRRTLRRKFANRCTNGVPRRLAIRLEHRPLRPANDRLFDEDEQASDVDVLPRRVGRHRPRAPHADVAAFGAEVADYVDAARREDLAFAVTERELERHFARLEIVRADAAHHFVRRRLVNAAFVVHARVDAGDVSDGRNEAVPFLGVRGRRV